MGLFSKQEKRATRLLFITDLHASEITFRKLMNAVEIYEATVLVIGGDLAGKRVVPIVHDADGYKTSVSGEDVVVNESGLQDVLAKIKNLGQYPFVLSIEEYQELSQDPDEVHQRFLKAADAQIDDWTARLAAKFEPKGIPVFVTGGNDDYMSIEAILDAAPWVVNAGEKVVEVAPGVEMVSTGFGNPTPWNCPRDVTEEELARIIGQVADKLQVPERAIFNLHVPPYGSGLDQAPLLDTSVMPPKPIVGETAPAGSTAVRDAVLKYKPQVGLHGHIHESRGIQKLGRTTCINPGSEYTEGLLRSAVVDLDKKGDLLNAQLLVA
jgi:Icc-related predicted phosphoesterase